MKKLVVAPNGWPCTLAECPPGLFTYNEALAVKSEYRSAEGYGTVKAYLADDGEFFAPLSDKTACDRLVVQPCVYKWVE